MNLRKHLRDKPEAHSSALNDILFILLLFFLIISTLANPNVIKVMTPKGESDTKAKQTVVVSIDSSQHIYVGTQLTQIDSLQHAIERMVRKSEDAEPTVVINPDKKANAESIYRVMYAAKKLQLRTVMSVDKEH
ncbi:MAG: biopolymer transporter ExbD [Bacteroidetes bacterium]|nr:biopolymer transporter ExbD [Bacteroidota bacterium]MBS1739110.1 biopolymer transporter ExbD [Bacteroidota bacterium]MBS1777201.1 biopolymer transporter ExbD [Bacteroidota bacterium]